MMEATMHVGPAKISLLRVGRTHKLEITLEEEIAAPGKIEVRTSKMYLDDYDQEKLIDLLMAMRDR